MRGSWSRRRVAMGAKIEMAVRLCGRSSRARATSLKPATKLALGLASRTSRESGDRSGDDRRQQSADPAAGGVMRTLAALIAGLRPLQHGSLQRSGHIVAAPQFHE